MWREKSAKIKLSPFTLVIWLTGLSMVFAIVLDSDQNISLLDRTIITISYWQQGFFGLLEFTLQMMMILVFGYSLAVVKPVHLTLKRLASLPRDQMEAVILTGGITCLAGLINWGFGLIIGAVFARFVTIAQEEKGLPSNPALLAAAGYLGMAVWHGGLSGSATLKVAEPNHFLEATLGIISVSETIFSEFNLLVTAGLIGVFMVVLVILAATEKPKIIAINPTPFSPFLPGKSWGIGAWVGGFILLICMGMLYSSNSPWTIINLNFVIFLVFGLALLAYKTLDQFTLAVGSGIKTSADIFIQFPFYAGILGIMTGSGLILRLSGFVLESTPVDLIPYFIFSSAAFVNLLIPSGGGQWAIQGPILAETSLSMDLPLGKMILLFAYGDQISNLLQPFWALPLLAITGVPAKALFKYCFWLFAAGFIFLSACIFLFF